MADISKISPDDGSTILNIKDNNAVHWGDQSKGYVGKNLVYKTLSGYNVYGNANGSEGFWIAAGTNGFVAIAKVEKNTNYTLTKDLGNRIRVIGFASEPVINGSHPADPTKYAQLAVGADELKTLSFNSGVFEYVACNLNSNTAYTGNMNAMVRLASIPDSTYEPYLTPNTEINKNETGTYTNAYDTDVLLSDASTWLIRCGKVAQLHLEFTVQTADTSGTWHKICSLGFIPQKENISCHLPWDSDLSGKRSVPIKIDTNGDVYVRPKITTTVITDILYLSV